MKYYPFTRIPDLGSDDFESLGRLTRLHPHVYGSSKGITIKFWHNGKMFEEVFGSRQEVLKFFNLPSDFPQ